MTIKIKSNISKIIFLILILAIMQTLYCIVNTLIFINNSYELRARVVEIPEHIHDGQYLEKNKDSIIIRFTTKEGQKYKYALRVAGDKDKYKVNDNVNILFNGKYEKAVINSFKDLWKSTYRAFLVLLVVLYFYAKGKTDKMKNMSETRKKFNMRRKKKRS